MSESIEAHTIIEEGDHLRYVCSNGLSFIVDKEDRAILESKTFCIDQRGYVTTDRKHTLLTHLLLGVDGTTIVDHINGNPFDNRKSNLRIASEHQNKWNYKLSKKNRSGYKGVSYFSKNRKYAAEIRVMGKRYFLGLYKDPAEAARAYDEAAREFYGDFAALNFPEAGEQGCHRSADTVVMEVRNERERTAC